MNLSFYLHRGRSAEDPAEDPKALEGLERAIGSSFSDRDPEGVTKRFFLEGAGPNSFTGLSLPSGFWNSVMGVKGV